MHKNRTKNFKQQIELLLVKPVVSGWAFVVIILNL
jgi:hypothetical protein